MSYDPDDNTCYRITDPCPPGECPDCDDRNPEPTEDFKAN